MRKTFAVLSVGLILVLALGGALAVVPHSHDGDFSHAQHKSCPLYQLSLHQADLSFQIAWSAFFFVLFGFVLVLPEGFRAGVAGFVHSSRAPPTFLS